MTIEELKIEIRNLLFIINKKKGIIDTLLKQNKELKKSCENFGHLKRVEEKHRKLNGELREENKRLQKENEKLNHYKLLYQKVKDRNDKAIEYIQTSSLEVNTKDFGMLTVCNSDDVLEILKGNIEEVSNEKR